MRSLPQRRRPLVVGLLALALLLGLLILGAPATSRLESGSTWHRGPAGYSAWYESLAQQGVDVQRWQRPIPELIERLENEDETLATLVQSRNLPQETMLVVLPGFIDQSDLTTLLPWMLRWIDAGHRLIVLGVKTRVTAAPFSQVIDSPAGPIAIDTRRRERVIVPEDVILQDEFGALAFQRHLGAKQITAVATPHLGANAYGDQPGNFAFLTNLLTADGGRLWVDEYLHGYRDADAIAAEVGGDSWLNYLARTPLMILFLQAIAVTLIALLAFNRRLGQRRSLQPPAVDNSKAYIQALAGVLHKAGSHDFVLQTLSQAERIHLQKSLGLGEKPVAIAQLQSAWNEQSGRPATDLGAILNPAAPKGDRSLRDWLKQLQSLHYHGSTTGDTGGHE